VESGAEQDHLCKTETTQLVIDNEQKRDRSWTSRRDSTDYWQPEMTMGQRVTGQVGQQI